MTFLELLRTQEGVDEVDEERAAEDEEEHGVFSIIGRGSSELSGVELARRLR